MQTSILERSDLSDSGSDEQHSEHVLGYANNKLGYRHPDKGHLTKNPLTEALRVIGLKPFTNSSVETYKSKRLKKYEIASALRFLEGPLTALALFLFVGSVIAFLTLVVALIKPDMQECKEMGVVLGIAVPVFLLLCVLVGKLQTSAEWEEIPLKSYTRHVPEFVLATAVEIHQRVPKVKLFVEDLVVRVDKRSSSADPFLVAEYKGYRYYLEVWEEPRYEQKREA